MKRIPVILDTDIGGDIADTWALGMLVNCPELDLRYVCAATGDTRYRAKVACKCLERVGRTDVAVGAGIRQPMDPLAKTQAAWVEDYELRSYPGAYHEDGVDRMVHLIMDAKAPLTLIAIGPLPNLAAALEREPRIAGRCHFVGMHGSIRVPYEGQTQLAAEYNVVSDIPSARKVFTAPWKSMTITPLDTCGRVRLKGDLYRKVLESAKPVPAGIIENYRIWRWVGDNIEKQSSILFDTVAVHLAYSRKYLTMQRMNVAVDDKGFTRERKRGALMQVAMDWTDLPAYENYLVRRLLA